MSGVNREKLIDAAVCVVGITLVGYGTYQIDPSLSCVSIGILLVGLVIVSRIGGHA